MKLNDTCSNSSLEKRKLARNRQIASKSSPRSCSATSIFGLNVYAVIAFDFEFHKRFSVLKMKRNMDLVRLLLMRSEGDDDAKKACENFSVEERAYHVQLLIDAGLVEGIVRKDSQDVAKGAIVSRLTWAGHEFLQSVRNDTVWKKAKEHVLKPGASWTFDILKDWVKSELKQTLGLPPQ
jgi:hypothetical protein